jgi:outer membrane receptor protein involved in Fe transport
MKTLNYAIILSALSLSASAQNIKGMVTDAQNHRPLAYSTVGLLKASDSSQVKGTLVGDNGTYQLENIKPGNYLLAAQMIGYTRKLVPVTIANETLTENIEVVSLNKQLSEVTIKATKPIVEHRADKLIFNVENSVLAAGNNGMELLKVTPLVTMGPDNNITLKGKSNVMVMINGKIIPGETAGNVLQSMSAEQIARIEVITNPSAKYDASASGGIINIVTKKGTNMGLNGVANLTASESDYGKYNGGVSLNYRDNKINIYGNINLRDGQGLRNEDMTRYLPSGTLQTPTELFTNGQAETGKIGLDYNLTKNSILGVAVDGLFSQSHNHALATSYFRDLNNVLDSVLKSTSKPGTHIQYTSYDLNYKNTLNTKGEELVMDLTHSHYSGLTQQDVLAQMIAIANNNPVQYSSLSTRTRALFNITTFQTDYTLPITSNTLLESGVKDNYTISANRSTNMDENTLTN